jgi:hypothetical protein
MINKGKNTICDMSVEKLRKKAFINSGPLFGTRGMGIIWREREDSLLARPVLSGERGNDRLLYFVLSLMIVNAIPHRKRQP